MNTTLLNIPVHIGCANCGSCCGIIPIDIDDAKRIAEYIRNGQRDALQVTKIAKRDLLTCPFRDEENKKCSIYPVRPIICRLFGVTKGMRCEKGNSREIDGLRFLKDYSATYMINEIDWNKLVSMKKGTAITHEKA